MDESARFRKRMRHGCEYGNALFEYSVDGGNSWDDYTEGSTSIELTGDGVYLLLFRAVDAAGNRPHSADQHKRTDDAYAVFEESGWKRL